MSVERGGEILREIFKAIMIVQFVTPSESCLHEYSFSRNAEQVCSPLLSFLLGGCRGVRTCIFDIQEQYDAYVWAYVVQCVGTVIVRIRVYEFTDTGILHFCYGRTNLHVQAYVRA